MHELATTISSVSSAASAAFIFFCRSLSFFFRAFLHHTKLLAAQRAARFRTPNTIVSGWVLRTRCVLVVFPAAGVYPRRNGAPLGAQLNLSRITDAMWVGWSDKWLFGTWGCPRARATFRQFRGFAGRAPPPAPAHIAQERSAGRSCTLSCWTVTGKRQTGMVREESC